MFELETATKYKIPVAAVIYNNNSWGMWPFSLAHFRLGEIYLERCGSSDRERPYCDAAAEAYKRAIANKPDLVEAHVALGKTYAALNRREEAIRIFNVAIALKPDSADAYYHLGSANYQFAADDTSDGKGKTALWYHSWAIKALLKATNLNPDDASAWHYLGKCYRSTGKNQEAIEAFKQGIRVDKQPYTGAYIDLFFVYKETSRLLDFSSSLKETIRTKPDDAYVHYWLGLVYVEMKSTILALDEYKILKRLKEDYWADTLFKEIYK
jgi:tetratricopeptide (TPR) repeat protein